MLSQNHYIDSIVGVAMSVGKLSVLGIFQPDSNAIQNLMALNMTVIISLYIMHGVNVTG